MPLWACICLTSGNVRAWACSCAGPASESERHLRIKIGYWKDTQKTNQIWTAKKEVLYSARLLKSSTAGFWEYPACFRPSVSSDRSDSVVKNFATTRKCSSMEGRSTSDPFRESLKLLRAALRSAGSEFIAALGWLPDRHYSPAIKAS